MAAALSTELLLMHSNGEQHNQHEQHTYGYCMLPATSVLSPHHHRHIHTQTHTNRKNPKRRNQENLPVAASWSSKACPQGRGTAHPVPTGNQTHHPDHQSYQCAAGQESDDECTIGQQQPATIGLLSLAGAMAGTAAEGDSSRSTVVLGERCIFWPD